MGKRMKKSMPTSMFITIMLMNKRIIIARILSVHRKQGMCIVIRRIFLVEIAPVRGMGR